MHQTQKRNVIFIQGETASGKSALSLHLAKTFGGVILNCDSVQIYKRLDIGSAKPSKEDFKSVPHYLYDIVGPPDVWTTGDYLREYKKVLSGLDIKTPIFLTGGTGFYFQAVEKGMFDIGAADPETILELENEIKEKGSAGLYVELQTGDPASAEKISINDHYRIVRALEVLRTHKVPISEIRKKLAEEQKNNSEFQDSRFLKLCVQIDKEKLAVRIHERVKVMIENGWIEETAALIKDGFENWSPLHSVGYWEIVNYLKSSSSLQMPTKININTVEIKSLADLISQGHRQLAKKQRTWFRRDAEVIRGESADIPLFEKAVREFLAV